MTDIAELFARDPREMTRDDLTQIVGKLRESRKQFNMGNVKAGSTKPKSASQKKGEELIAKTGLNLSDLL